MSWALLCGRNSFNAARGFVGGATGGGLVDTYTIVGFNAARGFVGGATQKGGTTKSEDWVSMPHAALWVVQR